MSTLIYNPRKPSKVVTVQPPQAFTFESATAEVLAERHPYLERATILTLAAMAALFLIFISFKKLDRVVTAEGRIVPTQGTLTVQPLNEAIISRIYVTVGEQVKKGQLLASCDPTFVHADLVGLQQKVESLQAQKRRMEAENGIHAVSPDSQSSYNQLQSAIGQKRLNELRSGTADFDERIHSTESDIAGLKENIADYSTRLKIALEQEKMYDQLELEKVTSRLQSLTMKDQATEMQRQVATAQNSLVSDEHNLASLKEQRKVYLEKWRDDNTSSLVDVNNQLDQAQDDLAKAQKNAELINLVSPADAVVLKVPDLSQGGIAKEADPLFSLLPLDAPMEIEVSVDAKDIGFVKVGDKVRVKLDAYRYLEHGWVDGVIRTISQDSFTEDPQQDELTRTNYNNPGETNRPPYFDARVSITKVNLRNVPPNTRLNPGMTLQADVVVGRRTILWYILGGALRSANEGMREPQ
jgi:hemolysin D